MGIYYKNVKLNYIFRFITSLNFTQGIWMLFMASRGLSLFEIGSLEAIFHITSFVMETPTGAIADIFGRKQSRLIAVVFSIISSVMIIFANTYIVYALSFVAAALSYNFESGAGEALVYDSLVTEKKEGKFMKVTGWLEVIFQSTTIIGLIVGGIIGDLEYVYVFYAAIVISVIAFVVGVFFKEPPIHGADNDDEKQRFGDAIKKQYVDSFKAVRGNRRLAYLMIFINLICAAGMVAFYYCQISLKDIGFAPSQIGITLGVSNVFAAIGAAFAEKIDKKFGEYILIKSMTLILSISVLMCFMTKYVIIPLSIIGFADAILYVASRDYINKHISSDKRATLLSFDSMMFSFSMILMFPAFGKISDALGIEKTFLILGSIVTLVALVNVKYTNDKVKKAQL